MEQSEDKMDVVAPEADLSKIPEDEGDHQEGQQGGKKKKKRKIQKYHRIHAHRNPLSDANFD